MGEWIEIELVEEPTKQRRIAVEPATPKPPRQPPGGTGRRRRLVAVGAGAVVVVVVGWAMARSDGDLGTGAPAATLDAPSAESTPTSELFGADATQPGSTVTTAPRVTTTVPAIAVAQLGGPMLPTPSGLQLVALTPQGDLVDIDLDTGEITTTDLPNGPSVGPSLGAGATILAGDEWTYLERWDSNQAFLVARGQPASDAVPSGALYGGALRGPDPDTMWVMQTDPATGAILALNLVNLDGEPLGRSIDLHGWWPTQSDLTGGVVVQASGGAYVVSELGARRVGDGELIGVGLNHFLIRDCDEELRCGLFVVDRQGGERRQVPVIQVGGLAQYYGWTGTDSASVAPDGSAAILFGLDGGASGAAVLGTDTGVYRTLTRADETFSIAWSDDSRYVVYTENRTLKVYDRLTGDTLDFGDDVPRVVNFAARP